ncbi:hypothetical protein [Streptomyces sp. NPDC091371]|uniref:hypothetical protein n=1 Tax=Streptomyces sp. NPDC091371 TaxID=3155303 RepID=UPI00342B949C
MTIRRTLDTGPRTTAHTPEPQRTRLAAEGTQTPPLAQTAAEQPRTPGRRTLGPGTTNN